MAETLAKFARESSLVLQTLSNEKKNEILLNIRTGLLNAREKASSANRIDLEVLSLSGSLHIQNAEKEVTAGTMSSSLFKRLDLFGKDGQKFDSLLTGITDIINMPDPIGKITLATELDTDLEMYRVVCPVGSILVIFEARPEVLIQISCLCIKSGNSVILKGGKEAINTLVILHEIVQSALESAGVPRTGVQLITTRTEVSELLKMDKYIDLVIPRGSKSLVVSVQENTRIPVLGHADGLCSIYIHEDADPRKVMLIVVDSKTDYPAACNSVETLLVHRGSVKLLGELFETLIGARVEIRADADVVSILPAHIQSRVLVASGEDFDTEFVDLIIAVRIVNSLEEAITHINTHGSRHTDCIITENEEAANKFMKMVDAAGVYWNASTRFADGFRYGFGAEIGVSTNKTHARGPVGLEGLTIYKYHVKGRGHTAGFYGPGKKEYLHRPLHWRK